MAFRAWAACGLALASEEWPPSAEVVGDSFANDPGGGHALFLSDAFDLGVVMWIKRKRHAYRSDLVGTFRSQAICHVAAGYSKVMHLARGRWAWNGGSGLNAWLTGGRARTPPHAACVAAELHDQGRGVLPGTFAGLVSRKDGVVASSQLDRRRAAGFGAAPASSSTTSAVKRPSARADIACGSKSRAGAPAAAARRLSIASTSPPLEGPAGAPPADGGRPRAGASFPGSMPTTRTPRPRRPNASRR